MLGRGRYRLLAEAGRDDRCGARLWRGRDSVLERDVALTLFTADPGDSGTVARIRAAVQRALRSARLETAGAARVLDVLEPEPGQGLTVAAVVAEWTHGRDLVEVVHDGLPPPPVAAAMLVPLAGAVDDAHRAGLVLGCDHPERIRVTPEGQARLAFPGPPAETGSRDDVRGLGAALYLLLTGRWTLEGGPSALPVAPRGPDGTLVSPRSLRPSVPLDLSTLAVRSLAGSGTGGVHTGAAVQRVLERSASGSEQTELLAPVTDRASVWHGPDEDPPPSPERRRKLGIGVAVLVAAILLIIGWLGFSLASVFTVGGDEGPPPVVVDGQPGDAPEPAAPPAAGPPAAGPVPVDRLEVYDISDVGDADNSGDVDLLVDGDPSTGWSTDSYQEPFPDYKPGLGVMLTFERPVSLAALTIDSPSKGTVVEVRSAPSNDPDLDETTMLGTATLGTGRTEVGLQAAPPTRYLLVWITTLAEVEGGNQSELSEVTALRAQ